MHHVIQRVMLALLMMAVGIPAWAARGDPTGPALESSMLVAGEIDVEADGTVSAVSLADEDALPPGVVGFVRAAAMAWRFVPVTDAAGAAMAVRAPVSVRLVARTRDDGKVQIAIRSASFDKYDPDDAGILRYGRFFPPKYPAEALGALAAGDTYTAVKVGRDGKVQDVATLQVNLNQVASETVMARWRQSLARASEKAIRRWTFKVPTEGAQADAPYWVVTVPTRYRISGVDRTAGKGQWATYVPGPARPMPWGEPAAAGREMSPDALADGGLYMQRDDGLRLLTPLDQG